ncbi:MAG: adenosine kinase [Verrucomicrobiales bacterium]|nr:adenosine kinase [Verrucomicrobiales bacterium]
MSKHIDLIAIGSPVVDLVARVDDNFVETLEGGKGGMELVGAIELEELVSSLDDEPEVAPGGSAGNTAYAAARLGSKVSFIGKLGDCEAATFYRQRFELIGADITRFKIGDIPNARCLSLVTADSQRTMRTDLGAAMTLRPDEITVEDFQAARHVHMEGYLAFNRDLMEKILECAKAAGCTTSFDLASFEVVKATGDILKHWLTEHIDVVFANEDEASAFFPELGDDYEEMAKAFAQLCGIAAVKLGKDGSLVAQGSDLHFIDPVVVTALDTTGAGDYWAGGFLDAWLKGKHLTECGKSGSVLGAEVVQVLGASLEEHRWESLNSAML